VNLVQQLLSKIAEEEKLVVIIGDAMADVWIHGHTEKCQDGCKKFVEVLRCTTPGGAANAERCLSNWGIATTLCGHWREARGTKTRYIDQDGKIVFRHDLDMLVGVEYDQTRQNALEWVGCASGVLLSDYDKGFITPEYIANIAGLCQQRGTPCVADCKRAPNVYAGCVLKGNEEWAKKYAAELEQFNGDVIITRGNLPPIVRCGRGKTG